MILNPWYPYASSSKMWMGSILQVQEVFFHMQVLKYYVAYDYSANCCQANNWKLSL